MSNIEENVEHTVPAEVAGNSGASTTATLGPTRNAFSELMASKGRQYPQFTKKAALIPASRLNASYGKNALAAYTTSPEEYSSSLVISYDSDFVVINDLFPKSSVHMLLLPRDPAKQVLHPFDAFEDPAFLAQVQCEIHKMKKIAASELRRRFGKSSAAEQARNAAMETDPPPLDLPPGRNWEKEIVAGVHAHPSMTHLHVHVMSVDRFNDSLRHRKHYNSFATPFFVPLEDFPLAQDDVRRHPGREGYLERDLVCWRCEKNFGNKFTRLKEHLEEEFKKWKVE